MRSRNLFNPWLVFLAGYCILSVVLIVRHCYPDQLTIRQSQDQYWRRVNIRSSRGIIRDRKGNVLVLSDELPSFAIDPSIMKEDEAALLSTVFSADVIAKLASSESRFAYLARKVSKEEGERIRSVPGLKSIKAFQDLREPDRYYPNGEMMAHVLGFCDIDNRGQSGIEQRWESVLYTPRGYRVTVRRPGAQQNINQGGTPKSNVPPVITLTIDSGLQYIVEKHLFKAASENRAKWASAVCIDPWSGAVLAMASWPTFNPGDRRTLSSASLFNSAISRAYEPGSTFKPIVMGIALDRGWVRTNEIFHCPAKLKVADGFITEAYPQAMGDIDTAQLLIKSSNVGMAQIGIRRGTDKSVMYESLCSFGFGREADVELPGVARGIVPPAEQWRGVGPANIAIGQGLAVTPLQLVCAMAPIVNGGKLFSPYIVQEARDSFGEVIYRGGTEAIREVMTAETAAWIRGVMRRTVTEGTGRRANTKVSELAGKTGTAQVPEGGKYSRDRYVASFIGFWPYSAPRYLMLVVIGEPSSGKYYGGELAAPPFKDIVEEMSEVEFYTPAE